MDTFARLLIPIAVTMVAAVLILGLLNMMRGGSANASQNFMRARVLGQLAAIAILMLALWLMGR